MKNKEFIASLAKRTGYKVSKAQNMMNTLIGAMGDTFIEGDAIQITSLGSFEVKKKMERVITNPATGQRMLVPPKLVLGFKPISSLKDKIKKGEKQ